MSAVVATEPTPPTTIAGRPSGGAARLLLVELRRYLARAGVRWLVVGMVAVVAITAFGAWRSSRPPTEQQLQQAQQDYRLQLTQWQQHGQEQIDSCKAAEADARQGDPSVDFGCDQMQAPTAEMFLPWRETFSQAAPGWLEQVSTFLLLLALVIGATFVAAEFSTGSITTWLTFEPRRGRVFASKLVAVTVATGVVVLVVAWLAIGAFWAATAVNHSAGDTTSQLWTALADRAGRLAVAGAVATAVGAALAFLVRHTAAVLGIAIGWLVVVDGIVASQIELTSPGIRRWMVQMNVSAWLQGGIENHVGATSCSTDSLGNTLCTGGTSLVVSMTHAGLVLGVVGAVVIALALVVFRRRDVA